MLLVPDITGGAAKSRPASGVRPHNRSNLCTLRLTSRLRTS